MPAKKPDSVRRNLLHDHPLLGKGAVHRKTRKALRRREKQFLRREWRDPAVPGGLPDRAIAGARA